MLELSDKQRNLVLGLMTAVILAVINFQIAGKQRIISDGSVMLLQLAPRDPRSLFQGDYMALRYRMSSTVAAQAEKARVSDGYAVVRLDDHQVAQFVRLHHDTQLAAGEQLLRFRKRGNSVRLASDAYFFEEGQSKTFSPARYGELRVDKEGNAVLFGLCDATYKRLGSTNIKE